MISYVSRPYPDELLYSWICRLADENAFSLPVFSEAYLGTGPVKQGQLSADVRREFPKLHRSLAFANDMGEMYLALSTFSYESIAMTVGQQTRYANNVFRPKSGLNPPVNALFENVRVCPECVRTDLEQHGEAYLHRSHQLSGVSMCHKHDTPLRTFRGTKGHECSFNGDDYAEIPSAFSETDRRAYAEYAHVLLAAGISSDSNMVKNTIFTRMEELGYGVSDGYEGFLEDFENWEHSGLWNGGDIVRFLKVKLISAAYLSMEEVVPLLMFLYPDASEAARTLDSGNPLLRQHTCPECGRIYCTLYADEEWGCPYCDVNIPEQERFRGLVAAAGQGEYELLSDFESMDRKVRFLHKPCGKTVEINPRSFLFEGVRCMCEYTISEEEARQAVEAHKGFKLIEFTRTDGPVTIYHEACGRQFKCTYRKFIEFPGCRACNPPEMTAELFRKRVHDLTDGEYEAVSDFVDQQTPVEILHTVCGRTQTYLPRHFISDQQRCHSCGKMPAWEKSLSVLEQYKSEYGSANISKRDSYRGYTLGRWCQGQRDNYKKGTLTEEQVRRLENIGFVWDPLEAEWQDNLERYKRYTEQNDSPYIPRRRDFEGVHLGAWVDTQRKRNSEGKLLKERRDKLLQINPDLF